MEEKESKPEEKKRDKKTRNRIFTRNLDLLLCLYYL